MDIFDFRKNLKPILNRLDVNGTYLCTTFGKQLAYQVSTYEPTTAANNNFLVRIHKKCLYMVGVLWIGIILLEAYS